MDWISSVDCSTGPTDDFRVFSSIVGNVIIDVLDERATPVFHAVDEPSSPL